MPQRVGARRQRLRARHQLDHGGLPRAVHAHQRHPVAALDHEARIAEHELLPVALRHVLELGHDAPAGLRLRELEVDGLLFRRNLDALDLVEFLDARLHLLGLGRLRAKAVDERLQLLDALALIAVRRRQAGRAARSSAAGTYRSCRYRTAPACSRSRRCGSPSRPENSGRAKSAGTRPDNSSDTIPASCALPDPGDWWAHPATAGSAFRAAVSPAPAASASRPRTPRCAAPSPPCGTPARRAPCPPAPRSHTRRDCGTRCRYDARDPPPRHIQDSPGPARPSCDAALPAPSPSRAGDRTPTSPRQTPCGR